MERQWAKINAIGSPELIMHWSHSGGKLGTIGTTRNKTCAKYLHRNEKDAIGQCAHRNIVFLCLKTEINLFSIISTKKRRLELRVAYLPSFTFIYLPLPLFTFIYLHLTSFTFIYFHLPSFMVIHIHLPSFTFICLS